MPQSRIRFKIILLASFSSFLLAKSPESFALTQTPDEEQPVHISANSLDAQEKSGISIYKGNVIVTQGSLTLKGDEIIVKHPNNLLKTVKATGQPARFKRFSQTDQSWLKGKANMIEYDALNKTVLLVGSAQVEQPGQHLIKGPKLFYDMTNQTLKAQSTEQEKGRISVTFNPATNTVPNPASENKPTTLPPEQ
ncbi:lipopolysaccharide transport periplasmic protein LptA [Thiomicrorhabdus arctica]|uniref:lipopolysaccharide transport periplasmic protein LptA n=1 Tax=Thiomicrorhabdus arctica TaxID=131540 RepID=UPI000365E73A|nr:lipopolysaccharide transport periplasmic protein LptA [Thiomicrorhabdus arctica]